MRAEYSIRWRAYSAASSLPARPTISSSRAVPVFNEPICASKSARRSRSTRTFAISRRITSSLTRPPMTNLTGGILKPSP